MIVATADESAAAIELAAASADVSAAIADDKAASSDDIAAIDEAAAADVIAPSPDVKAAIWDDTAARDEDSAASTDDAAAIDEDSAAAALVAAACLLCRPSGAAKVVGAASAISARAVSNLILAVENLVTKGCYGKVRKGVMERHERVLWKGTKVTRSQRRTGETSDCLIFESDERKMGIVKNTAVLICAEPESRLRRMSQG